MIIDGFVGQNLPAPDQFCRATRQCNLTCNPSQM